MRRKRSRIPTKQPSWEDLHERFEVKRINHQEAYSLDGARTNMAEEYFSRLRRAEIGIHHHIARSYLLRYAQESSWREDNRRVSNGDQVNRITALALKRGKSVDFTGYWHRATFQVAEDFTSSASPSTRKAYHSSGLASAFGGGLNRSTQHFILEGKDGV